MYESVNRQLRPKHSIRPRVAFVSFRLGGTDGVAVAARTWMRAFRDFGFEVRTIAGSGTCDLTLPWLAIGSTEQPDARELCAAVRDVDLVVVENLLTIPLNVPASAAVARALSGRPALIHHHDPPWHRPLLPGGSGLPASDPAWTHVTISSTAQQEFRVHGIPSTVVYNGFDLGRGPSDRSRVRAELGFGPDELVFLHPVRAIERKGIAQAVAFAERMQATYLADRASRGRLRPGPGAHPGRRSGACGAPCRADQRDGVGLQLG